MVGVLGNRDRMSKLSVTLTSVFLVEIRDCIDSYMNDLCKQECDV